MSDLNDRRIFIAAERSLLAGNRTYVGVAVGGLALAGYLALNTQ